MSSNFPRTLLMAFGLALAGLILLRTLSPLDILSVLVASLMALYAIIGMSVRRALIEYHNWTEWHREASADAE